MLDTKELDDPEISSLKGRLLIKAGVLRADGKKGVKFERVAEVSRQPESATRQWLCKVERKDPNDFKVEGREHAPDPDSPHVHRDVVVRYIPTGRGRRYCPDYGESWIVKFVDDLEVHYFSPQDDIEPRGLVVWS